MLANSFEKPSQHIYFRVSHSVIGEQVTINQNGLSLASIIDRLGLNVTKKIQNLNNIVIFGVSKLFDYKTDENYNVEIIWSKTNVKVGTPKIFKNSE